MSEYPTLTREDILAALRYSSQFMANHYTLEQKVGIHRRYCTTPTIMAADLTDLTNLAWCSLDAKIK